jgi:hypothetical protein
MLESISYIGTQTNENNKTNDSLKTEEHDFKISNIRIEPKNMQNIKKITTFINLPIERNKQKSKSPGTGKKMIKNRYNNN